MKVGYFALGIGPGTEPAWVRTIATNAERLGFDTIWAPEHVVLLDRYASRYPYSSGEFPTPLDTPFSEPITTLAFAAACTNRIKLATGICLVPEHNPLALAKSVATVDRLSGGRFILGVGIGWLEEEFQAIGVPWDRRGQRTREYIDAMRRLWADRLSSYKGEFVNFSGVLSFPKPANGNSVPVWFGGESGPALRRVAEARGLAKVAKTAGVERESLYRALSPRGNPRLSTLVAVTKAMGLKLTFESGR
jgi:probable F420-dependent oxidoreductase